MAQVIENNPGGKIPQSRRKFRAPRSRQTLEIGDSVISERNSTSDSSLPVAPVNSDAARRRHQVYVRMSRQVRPVDAHVSSLSGPKPTFERHGYHWKDDIGRARQAIDRAAPSLQGTPLASDAESIMQEAIAIAMYLAERLESLNDGRGRFALSAAVGRALSRRFDTDPKAS